MNIKSNNINYINKDVKVANTTLSFDAKGVAVIDNEDKAKEIIALFPDGRFYEEGNEPVVEIKKENIEDPIDSNELQKLLDEKEIELVKLKEDLDSKEKLIEELKDSKNGTSVEEVNVIYDLAKKSKGDLQSDCTALQLNEEEWKEKNHKELVIYLATL